MTEKYKPIRMPVEGDPYITIERDGDAWWGWAVRLIVPNAFYGALPKWRLTQKGAERTGRRLLAKYNRRKQREVKAYTLK